MKLQQELAYYNRILPHILGETGRFVLIRGETVEGFYDSYRSGLSSGYEKYPEGSFFLKQIQPVDVPLSLPADTKTW